MPERKTLNEDLFYRGSSANLPRLHTCENKIPFWDFSQFALTPIKTERQTVCNIYDQINMQEWIRISIFYSNNYIKSHKSMHTHTHTSARAQDTHIHTHAYVCVCVCAYIYIYIYMHHNDYRVYPIPLSLYIYISKRSIKATMHATVYNDII